MSLYLYLLQTVAFVNLSIINNSQFILLAENEFTKVRSRVLETAENLSKMKRNFLKIAGSDLSSTVHSKHQCLQFLREPAKSLISLNFLSVYLHY